MKKRVLIFIVCLNNFPTYLITNSPNYLDLKQLNQEQYQDIIINGKVVSKGTRDCAKRYEAIKPILNQYNRPITVLDLGASQGYFSFRIADEYDATCIMIEGNYSNKWKIADQLEDLCRLNTNLDTIILLKKHISASELKKLGECEHFDVVLAFNIIHHFGAQWKNAADAILSLGDNIIIETPPANDSIAKSNKTVPLVYDYVRKQEGKLIAEIPRHTSKTLGKMYWIERKKDEIILSSWAHVHQPRRGIYKIESDFQEKSLYNKSRKLKTEWKKGINLTTFKALNGSFPSYKHIRQQISDIGKIKHNDLAIWNLIIQGNTIIPIDTDDTRWIVNQPKALSLLLTLFDDSTEKNPEQKLRQYYNDIQHLKI